MHQPMHFNIQ